jgi:hypothetical protein
MRRIDGHGVAGAVRENPHDDGGRFAARADAQLAAAALGLESSHAGAMVFDAAREPVLDFRVHPPHGTQP